MNRATSAAVGLATRRRFIRDALLAAAGSAVALEALGRSAAAAPATLVAEDRISMIGDSLTSGSIPYQSAAFSADGWPSSAIDAFGSRGVLTKMARDPHTGLTAVDAIRAKNGDSDLWVVALGTNDALVQSPAHYSAVINAMLDHIGSGHRVLWVNAYLRKSAVRQTAWNEALAEVARERPAEVVVYDWAAVADQQRTWIAGDGVHCTRAGYQGRAAEIAAASLRVLEEHRGSCLSWKTPR